MIYTVYQNNIASIQGVITLWFISYQISYCFEPEQEAFLLLTPGGPKPSNQAPFKKNSNTLQEESSLP